MSDSVENNKRIAKNTLFLYFRMIIIMVVTLFTSRVILKSLGVEDYGIYNVVGGIIAMFSFVRGSLTTTTQRYITFELGKADDGDINKIFSTSILLHLIFALAIAIIAEPIGIWFIQNKLMIEPEKLNAAIWVYHFTVLTMAVMFIGVPYNSLIIAYEEMNIYAIISILEAFLRLVVAYLIVISKSGRLILYALLLFAVQLIIQLTYIVYSNRKFHSVHFKFCWDAGLLKEILKFASWSLFGNIAFVTYTQGLNLLLGTFFSPVVNAARGIAVQVQGAVNSFVQNFQTAVNPQITKSYASGKIAEMLSLVFRSSRLSFYLLMIISVPILLETQFILKVWLNTVPEYTVTFLRIILLTTWINSIANPLIIVVKATGKVKKYESTVGIIMMLILPVSYMFLKFGYQPEIVFIVHLCFECIAMLFRILITKSLVGFSSRMYLKEVLLPIFIVILASLSIPLLLYYEIEAGVLRFFIVGAVSVICSCLSIYFCGLTTKERSYIVTLIKTRYNVA